MPLLIEYTWLTQIPCFGVFTRIIGMNIQLHIRLRETYVRPS